MAKLIPTLIVFVCFSALLSFSYAETPVTSPEDDVTKLPPATFSEEDVSDLKSLIVLPTRNLKDVDAVNQPGSAELSDQIHVKDIPMMNSFEIGEKKPEEFRPTANWRLIDHRNHPIRCRYGRFGAGGQIRPQKMPIWKFEKESIDDEHHHHPHHHHHHHGEGFPARFPDVDGEGRMIGEFKEPHFFFRPHHHHHHRHHHDDDDEDRFHHGEEEEMEHHHRHRRGHGFWKTVRKFLGHF